MDPNTWTQYYSRLNQVAAPQQEQPTYANAPQFLLAQQIRYERRSTKELTPLSEGCHLDIKAVRVMTHWKYLCEGTSGQISFKASRLHF